MSAPINNILFKLLRYGSAEYHEMLSFRNAYMRIPIGLCLFDEDLSQEIFDHHIGVCRQGKLVGCCIITPETDTRARMRQVVIAPSERGQGIGHQMMLYAEEKARALGFSLLVLDSRMTAVHFYQTLGYQTVGEPFMEVGLPHYRMEKQIKI